MKRLLSLLWIPLMACLMGFTPITVPPEARIKMSAWSDRILLVEITKITITDGKPRDDGLASREVSLEGTVVEIIRGEQKTKTFKATETLVRVVDAKAAQDHVDWMVLSEIGASYNQSGIADCKEGKRYVVNFTGADCRFAKAVFFAEVPKDKDVWRKEILPRRHPEDEEKANAK